MFRKLIHFICVCFVLGLAFTSVVKADLVGWWRLDEGAGTTAFDSSGNGRDGTLNGDPQWVAGYLGGALEFDGDDHVDTGYSGTLQTGPLLPGSRAQLLLLEIRPAGRSIESRIISSIGTTAMRRSVVRPR